MKMTYNKYKKIGDPQKTEDAIMKKSMELFAESALAFFNVHDKIKRVANVEIKDITIKTHVLDYLYETESGEFIHFEFQTTRSCDNLPRFLCYDAALFQRERKLIKTIVVYSAEIKKENHLINAGSIHYEVENFYMSQFDGDILFELIKEKINHNVTLTEEELVKLTFIPLMGSKKSKSKLTIDCLNLAQNLEEQQKAKCIVLLYGLFDKFGDEISKKKFKEVFQMTEVGRMIHEEGEQIGIEKGIEKGMKKAKIENAVSLLDILNDEMIAKKIKLPLETVRQLRVQHRFDVSE